MIFIALALAWAVYLIPKAVQHHEEMARTRNVESFSARLRVLGGTRRSSDSSASSDSAPAPVPVPATQPVATATAASEGPADIQPQWRSLLTRESAARAAARRRRVLYALTGLLVLTVGLAAGGILPWLTVVAPVVLIGAFLFTAARTVKAQQLRRSAAVAPSYAEASDSSDVEDTAGISRTELAEELDLEVEEQPLADDGSLWDPLPMQLPTYVNKPRARRTVRTVELTRGITSSGHDAEDSKLAREAEAARAQENDAEAQPQRRVAGA